LPDEPTTEAHDRLRIQISHVPMAATELEIRAMFLPHGTVQSFDRPMNDHTYRPGPIAFVEMARNSALAAIEALNGTRLGKEVVSVTVATTASTWTAPRAPSPERPRRTITPRGAPEPRRFPRD
jgi:hypothetical protein